MPDTTSKKILVIDDDPSLRQMYSLQLQSKNYVVIEAGDGEEGLQKIKDEKPSLILLDISMPKLDGIAMLSQMKQDVAIASTPVIMLTNYGQENLVKQAFDLGVTDYLLKYKVAPEEISEKVTQILSAKPVEL